MVVNDNDHQMILDNIDEYVKDEDRIVTYRWLSLTLSINMDKAKKCLEEYYEKCGSDLQATYFVGGMKNNDEYGKTYSCQLTRKEKLKDVESEYDDKFSYHIYSIQKCKLKDSGLLYACDVDIIKESLDKISELTSLRSEVSKATRRTVETSNGNTHHREVAISKAKDVTKVEKQEKSNPPPPASSKSAAKESPPLSFFGKKAGKSTKSKETEKSEKPEKPKETKPDKNKKSGIAGAFSHSKVKKEAHTDIQTKSNVDTDGEKVSDNKLDEKSKDGTSASKLSLSKKRKASNRISDSDDDFEDFISNTSNKNKSIEKEENKKIEKDTHIDVDDSSVNLIEATPESTKPKSKRRKKDKINDDKEKESVKKEKESVEKEKESVEKEQKEVDNQPSNVIQISSDRSESISSHQSSDGSKTHKKHGRRRVLKTKQFVDEDGFMVTKKEYESESYSEDSDTDQAKDNKNNINEKVTALKKTEKELEKKSIAHNKKSKQQTSMTSFFKRK